MYTSVHSGTVHNSPKLEMTHMSITWWMNMPDMVYPDNGIASGGKKDGTTQACYNMDEPNKYYAEWKKTDAKDILYDSFYMKCLKTQIYRDRKWNSHCLGMVGGNRD